MQAVDVSIIVVSYNSAAGITASVESVLRQSGVHFEVVVVDNASSDNTMERLQGLNCRVISSPENLGFGRGCNLGFASSTGRYLYLLNPDASLLKENALADLCRQMDTHPEWGLAGTRVLSTDGKHESPPATHYPGQRHVKRDFSKLPGQIAWVIGASMIVRREIYEKLGGFDPEFFLYSEETDFCLRVRELGFAIGHVQAVAVTHIGGASEDPRDPYAITVRKLSGLLRFRQKHYSPADCTRLAQRDLKRARFRMLWYGWLAGLQPTHSKAWQKYRNYCAIRDLSREYLCGKHRQILLSL